LTGQTRPQRPKTTENDYENDFPTTENDKKRPETTENDFPTTKNEKKRFSNDKKRIHAQKHGGHGGHG
jgi:hypothetical protein